MKKHFFKIIILLIVTIIIAFYLGKRREINNVLNPNNVKVKALNSNFEFNQINKNDTLKYTFYIKNLSKNDLIIKNALSNCGCTISNFDKAPVKQNDTAKIFVKFIPNKVGKTEKNIVVEANTSPPFTVLTLKGNVIE
jgi:hypothetical protein